MIQHQIVVPLVFSVKALKSSRHSVATPAVLFEMIELTLHEAVDAEAPVAARYKASNTPEALLPVRVLDGQFYQPVHESRWSGDPSQYLMSQELVEMAQAGSAQHHPIFPRTMDYLYRDFQSGEALDASEYQGIVQSSTREDMLAQVRSNAEALLLVDGLVYTRVQRPVYKVGSKSSMTTVDMAVGPIDSFKDKSEHNVFPLHRFQDAVDLIVSMGGDDPGDYWKAEVYLPEAFNIDVDRPAVVALLQTALAKDRQGLSDAHIDRMLAWGRLRDAVSHAIQTDDDDDFDAVFDVFLPEYEASPGALPETSKAFGKARDRWQMRDFTAMKP